MKRSYLISILILFLTATNGYSESTHRWAPAHIKEIRLLKHSKEVTVVKDTQDINAIAQCLSRADTIVKVTFWSFIFGSKKHKEVKYKADSGIDIIGDKPESGRWMYDSQQGIFTYLDPFIHSIYKLKEKDRAVINLFFETDSDSSEKK